MRTGYTVLEGSQNAVTKNRTKQQHKSRTETKKVCRNRSLGTRWKPILEPGTSLCMEELGDEFQFVFEVFGVFGCCLTHVSGT